MTEEPRSPLQRVAEDSVQPHADWSRRVMAAYSRRAAVGRPTSVWPKFAVAVVAVLMLGVPASYALLGGSRNPTVGPPPQGLLPSGFASALPLPTPSLPGILPGGSASPSPSSSAPGPGASATPGGPGSNPSPRPRPSVSRSNSGPQNPHGGAASVSVCNSGPLPAGPSPWCQGSQETTTADTPPDYVLDFGIFRDARNGPGTLTFAAMDEVDYVILRGTTPLWTWSAGQQFAPTQHMLIVDPNQAYDWVVRWDGVLDSGEPLAKGSYTLRGISTASELRNSDGTNGYADSTFTVG